MTRHTVLGPLLALSLAACGGDDCPEGDAAITTFDASPTSVAAGGMVDITFAVENFELEDHDETMAMGDTGMEMGSGETHTEEESTCLGGHAHIYLDDLETNPLVMTGATSFMVTIPSDTTAGSHTLIARLHDRDHLIVEPQVTAEVELEITAR